MAEQEPDEMDTQGEAQDAGGGILSQAELDALLAAAEGELGEAGAEGAASGGEDDAPVPAPSVVDLPFFDAPDAGGGLLGDIVTGGSAGHGSMGRVRDIPLDVSVELGRTRLLIRDILDLGTGSIIELDKLAGEPVDLFANGLLVARGEVIVIDDNFGVRVTEIITAAERRQIQDAEADTLAA